MASEWPSVRSASVVAVNISAGGIPKWPLRVGEATEAGIAGDAHNHEKHNTPLQAICLLDLEIIEQLAEEGFNVSPGAVGENLTVRGLDVERCEIGDRLVFSGGLEIELTKRRTPCYVLDAIHPQLKKAMVGRAGLYAKVISPGRVSPGETIAVRRQAVSSGR